MCKYALVTATLPCPAAARTSANVRPPANACEINVCRPWRIVRDDRRSRPRTLQADKKRRRIAARWMWACDFFSKNVWTRGGLVEVFVLVFIHVGTRRVRVAGM